MKKKYLQISEKAILIDNYLFPRMLYIDKTGVHNYPINSTGILILSVCDGKRTEEDIVEYVSDYYKIEKEQIKQDIKQFLAKFVNLNIVRKSEYFEKINVDRRGKDNIVLPFQLSFEVTNQCQLKCKHCYNESGSKRNKEFEVHEIINILEQYKKLGGTSVMLTGGELFLKKDIYELLNYVYDNFMKIVLFSNAYTISDELLNLLENMKDKIVIQVSLDGMEEQHDLVRGVFGAFRKTVENIRKLVKREIAVCIGTTLNNSNLKDIEDVVKYAKELGCVSINIGVVTPQGRAKKTGINGEDVIDKFDIILKRLKAKYEDESFIVGRSEEKCAENCKLSENERKNICGAGYKIIHVFANGNVGLCPSSQGTLSKINLGDLRNEKLEEILDISRIGFVMNIPSPNDKECGECELKKGCANCISTMLGRTVEECAIVRRLYEKHIIN